MNKVRIGVVGANPDRGWAQKSHLPALSVLPEFELAAVCTTRRASADAAAAKFGATRAYDNAQDLIRDPSIDAVAVIVRVDKHHDLVMAALEAGKHVFCEWPLGRVTDEARQMTELALARGVVHQVGFQTRANPRLVQMRDLVKAGFLGELRSVTLVSAIDRWGAEIPAELSFAADADVGVNIVSVNAGHSLDALCFCLGEFAQFNATVANLRKQARLVETGKVIPYTSPDQLVVNGRLENGAVVSAHLQSGSLNNLGFRMIARGTEGELVLSSDGSIPTGALRLEGFRRGETAAADIDAIAPALAFPAAVAELPQVTASIAAGYRSFAEAIRTGGRASPGFDEALGRHRLLDAMYEASATGRRHQADRTAESIKTPARTAAGPGVL